MVAVSNGEIAVMQFDAIARFKLEHPKIALRLMSFLAELTMKKLGEIEEALRAERQKTERLLLNIRFAEGYFKDIPFVAESPAMKNILNQVRLVSATPVNVLIQGENGTGKELMAQTIHLLSPRSQKPFIAINCALLSENFLATELFGHTKGAFTGAYSDKPGLFEIAQGGTIFLDEIAELPSLLQVKLLRVIQEKAFRRVGGSKDITVDVRVIAATNQDLEQEVKNGSFREDLYYRLNVIPIHIPPLRRRKEDIPVLTTHFVERYYREFRKEIKKISSYAMELLMGYRFPGNVRELENIIERSVALETSNIVLPENLALSKNDKHDRRTTLDIELPEEGINLNEEMAKIEKSFIIEALEKAKGSKSKAAELLSVSLDSLRYRLEKLDLR